MASSAVCPVVGTTNTVLPPSHPEFNMDEPGLVCPVVGASTDHHKNLSRHPGLPSGQGSSDASACPALKQAVKQPDAQAMDEALCPIVGTVSSVLPPDHPSMKGNKEGDVCPVTKATLGTSYSACDFVTSRPS